MCVVVGHVEEDIGEEVKAQRKTVRGVRTNFARQYLRRVVRNVGRQRSAKEDWRDRRLWNRPRLTTRREDR